MATNPTGTRQTGAATATKPAPLPQDAAIRRAGTPSASSSGISAGSPAKLSGYGLPCAKCRLYYPAHLDACPTCHHRERVSLAVPKIPPKAKQPTPDRAPDNAAVEQEREEFLRQFKSQLAEAHSGQANSSSAVCSFGEHIPGDDTKATICQSCFDRLQERLDLCETALHLDSKEASQIIYDAVWADPSDPSKTYENAANALLAEIRKRAGITSIMPPFQSVSD